MDWFRLNSRLARRRVWLRSLPRRGKTGSLKGRENAECHYASGRRTRSAAIERLRAHIWRQRTALCGSARRSRSAHIERLATSDALYHNAEHTALVALVAQDIVRGLRLTRNISPEDWFHYILAALTHDLGMCAECVQATTATARSSTRPATRCWSRAELRTHAWLHTTFPDHRSRYECASRGIHSSMANGSHAPSS